MAQTKEERDEMARRKRQSEKKAERLSDIVRGRPLRDGEGRYPRCEWETFPYDERKPPGPAYTRYNYRLRRFEWSYGPIPADVAADYDPSLYPKTPDGRSAIMAISAASVIETGPLAGVPVVAGKPRRKWTLPPIDNLRR